MKRLLSLAFFLALVFTSLPVSAQTANAAAYYNAGNQFYASKDYTKAVSYYKYATQLDPANAASFQGLGNAYYQLGQKPEALAAYQQAKTLNPSATQLDPVINYLQTQVNSTPPLPSAPPAGNSQLPYRNSLDKKLEIDVNAGFALGTNSGYGFGFGGGAGAYYMLDKNLGLGLNLGYYTFSRGSASGSNGNESASISASEGELEFAACGKYVMEGENLHPFLFGGVGIADRIVSVSASVSSGSSTEGGSASASETDPMIVFGGGLSIPAGQNMDFFARVKVSIVMVPGVPVTTGYNSATGTYTTTNEGGGTLMYIPVEGGLAFNM